jgi:hypothetical protein
MAAEQIYPYRAKSTTMIWVILLFGAAALGLADEARTNTRGLLLDRIIHLRPDEATFFYYGLAVMSAAFVLIGIFSLYISLTRKTVLILGPSSITASPGLARAERTIAYADIKSIQHRRVRSQEFLTITPGIGKSLSIAASMLPSKDVFISVRAELTARAKAARNL